MRNKLLISEQERSNILSMYRLIYEDVTTKISGKVNTIPGISYSNASRGVNLKIDLYSDENTEDVETLGDNDDITELRLIDTTTTDGAGNFYFDNITDNINLVIRFDGNDFFNPSELKLKKITPNQETKITLTVYSKNEEYIEKEDDVDYYEPKPNKYCNKKESNDKNIFGLGFYEEKTYPSPDSILKYNKEKFILNANAVGILDAFNTYLTLYPNDKVTAEKMVDAMDDAATKTFSPPKYRVPCKRVFSEKGNFVASTLVKFKKKKLDELVEYVILKDHPKIEPLDFDPYDFQRALEVSYDLKRKIFLFVCSDTNQECNNIFNELIYLKNIKEKLKFFVRLYYQVNRNETKKYVLASESLNIDTYPTMVILEAIKDPRTNPIKNSVKLIKKITEFNNLEENINNLLS